MVCREVYGLRDCRGYLRGGLPEEYGEGAMEVIRNRKKFLSEFNENSDLHSGDIERVDIEWKSLLSLIAYAPAIEVPDGLGFRNWLSKLLARQMFLISYPSCRNYLHASERGLKMPILVQLAESLIRFFESHFKTGDPFGISN